MIESLLPFERWSLGATVSLEGLEWVVIEHGVRTNSLLHVIYYRLLRKDVADDRRHQLPWSVWQQDYKEYPEDV